MLYFLISILSFSETLAVKYEYPLTIQRGMTGAVFSHFYCSDYNPSTLEAFYLGATSGTELGVVAGIDPLLVKYNEKTEEIELLHTFKDNSVAIEMFNSCTFDASYENLLFVTRESLTFGLLDPETGLISRHYIWSTTAS